MTEHRSMKIDRKRLVVAFESLARGRARLDETKGDPFWGPILGDLGVALAVLERRLDEIERAMEPSKP